MGLRPRKTPVIKLMTNTPYFPSEPVDLFSLISFESHHISIPSEAVSDKSSKHSEKAIRSNKFSKPLELEIIPKAAHPRQQLDAKSRHAGRCAKLAWGDYTSRVKRYVRNSSKCVRLPACGLYAQFCNFIKDFKTYVFNKVGKEKLRLIHRIHYWFS